MDDGREDEKKTDEKGTKKIKTCERSESIPQGFR